MHLESCLDPALSALPVVKYLLTDCKAMYSPALVGRCRRLLDYLEAGVTIDDFLEGFPSVSRDQVIAFLEMAKDRLIESAL